MELKKFVRRGIIEECQRYRPVLKYDGQMPEYIIMLLEGKGRRKLLLSGNRYLYENYYATAFIGLEDYILEKSRIGGVGLFPGSHYVLWEGQDFLNALGFQPELARRAIFELSRRVRIYDSHQRRTDSLFKMEPSINIGPPQDFLSNTLYEISFADEDNFPEHLVEKLNKNFSDGEYLMKQGDEESELYIITKGLVKIFQTDDSGKTKELDSLNPGEMVGEMAQFDGLPRSADARAVGMVETLSFKAENFHLLFQLHPKWSYKLLKTLALRIAQRLESFETVDLNTLKT